MKSDRLSDFPPLLLRESLALVPTSSPVLNLTLASAPRWPTGASFPFPTVNMAKFMYLMIPLQFVHLSNKLICELSRVQRASCLYEFTRFDSSMAFWDATHSARSLHSSCSTDSADLSGSAGSTGSTGSTGSIGSIGSTSSVG